MLTVKNSNLIFKEKVTFGFMWFPATEDKVNHALNFLTAQQYMLTFL